LLRIRLFGLVLALTLAIAAPALAKDKALEQSHAGIQAKLETLRNGVDDLVVNYANEIDERDRLMLRRRFVEGREFFYELHDYRGASEVFYSIVNHPLAATLPNADAAVYYLAESLFHSGYLTEADGQYQKLVAKGPSNLFAMSLIRQIEIAVERRSYSRAESLYAVLLSQLPEYEDGSLGRYIIGKSYVQRGEIAKAIEVLDSIPESGAYYATAQYYAAVIFVKQKSYREAINRLRTLKKSLKDDVANKEQLYSLTHLAMARISYEINDFPQAMANYEAVPEATPGYEDALYESIWVFITRNDYLLKAIEDERTNYQDLVYEFAQFRDTVEYQEDKESVAPVEGEAAPLAADLDEMAVTFGEIDTGLARLQEEAIESFNKLVQAAPHNPQVPSAELLVGNIYSQVEQYETAEQWFAKLKSKYEDFYASVAAVRPRYSPADYVAVVDNASSSLEDGSPLSPATLKGLPPEVAYWLAADTQVKQIFNIYDGVARERRNVMKMHELVAEIENKLQDLELGMETPFLREANRRWLEYQAEIQTLQVDVMNLRNQATASEDTELGQQIVTTAGSYEAELVNMQNRLAGLDEQIENKKRERLVYFRQQLVTLRAPLGDFDRQVNALLASSGNVMAQVAEAELASLESQVAQYAQQADLGIVDVAYRSTRGSNWEMRKIQQEMSEELRELRRQDELDAAPPADTTEGGEGE
jgi:tetratricopeptide (TPR) repeat protein